MRNKERGAAAVEFAIILPVFVMLAVGMFTGGLTYNNKDHITHAAREGARYGSVLPKGDFATAAAWATSVRDSAVDRSDGVIDLSLTGHSVCVALVTGKGNGRTVVSGAGGSYAIGLPSQPLSSGGDGCFADGGADESERVQVAIERPGQISAVFFEMNPTLRSQAVARYEILVVEES